MYRFPVPYRKYSKIGPTMSLLIEVLMENAEIRLTTGCNHLLYGPSSFNEDLSSVL
jgi:hypothetical protein